MLSATSIFFYYNQCYMFLGHIENLSHIENEKAQNRLSSPIVDESDFANALISNHKVFFIAWDFESEVHVFSVTIQKFSMKLLLPTIDCFFYRILTNFDDILRIRILKWIIPTDKLSIAQKVHLIRRRWFKSSSASKK